jgi:hypothetical protein
MPNETSSTTSIIAWGTTRAAFPWTWSTQFLHGELAALAVRRRHELGHRVREVRLRQPAFETELEPNFFVSDPRNLKPGGRYNESAYDFRCELNNYSADRAPSDRRPSSYETFPLFAEVLVSGDPTRYRSTLTPTNHWSNRPEAGAL